MSTMNLSLPDDLRRHVEDQARELGFRTGSEYIRELIRRDIEVGALRELLEAGVASPVVGEAGADWFEALRAKSRAHQAKA